eukprot:TRINITY_DN8654_c0_g1_i1.p1 TRINITY_DN8654_c0_g1~~TRINITY_DN8654_c0_g1_i1.p1  ORF type:complete len:161 (+),score=20.94 TRINITY_DN8654_c0_g1_i1:197-679(+)
MDLEVVGHHALLFDDDAMAAFVNSADALIQWNSLVIDRYDVRHLLQDAPPPTKRRRSLPLLEYGVSLSDLDLERFQDLPPTEGDDDHQGTPRETNKEAESASDGTYRAVAFSYGSNDVSGDVKNLDSGLGYSGFHPPFQVPESLLQNLVSIHIYFAYCWI